MRSGSDGNAGRPLPALRWRSLHGSCERQPLRAVLEVPQLRCLHEMMHGSAPRTTQAPRRPPGKAGGSRTRALRAVGPAPVAGAHEEGRTLTVPPPQLFHAFFRGKGLSRQYPHPLGIFPHRCDDATTSSRGGIRAICDEHAGTPVALKRTTALWIPRSLPPAEGRRRPTWTR